MISDWFSPLGVSQVTSELIIRGVRTCNRKKAPQARNFLFRDMKNIDLPIRNGTKMQKTPLFGLIRAEGANFFWGLRRFNEKAPPCFRRSENKGGRDGHKDFGMPVSPKEFHK